MTGRILKGIGSFYYVQDDDTCAVAECRLRGGLRKGARPLVGDRVEYETSSDASAQAVVTALLPRSNAIGRPEVANVDLALLVFAYDQPVPSLKMIDRLLVRMAADGLTCLLCFNKLDLASADLVDNLRRTYSRSQAAVYSVSAQSGDTGELPSALIGHTAVVAGPSGVGKSTLVNLLCGAAVMETGEVSSGIGRGRHTTRHAELFPLGNGGYICDTPGFGSLDIANIPSVSLQSYYPEFDPYVGRCRFDSCMHVNEPDCAVKSAVAVGEIPTSRYDSYINQFEELKVRERTYK